ncbi:putative solid-state culture specific protein [Aspergillus foveolatus]|uniref:putative solid-state culture specific protein n=1 Tax=Aspergillus foveolatus TaxID=210207 RepID=UPI003CCCE768
MSRPSPIILDYTLRDLYTSDTEGSLDTVLVYYPLQFEHNHRNKEVKYVYGYNMEEEDEGATSSSTMAASLVPQRYAFSAGRVPLVILDMVAQGKLISEREGNSQAAGSVPAHQLDIYRTFAQLNPDQRPSVVIAKSPDSIELGLGARIAILQPTDCVSHLPHLICPEAHYEILSKRGLALSGLPTPPSRVIDAIIADYGDPSLLAEETARITGYIEQYQVPFMVKLSQSISGMGTFVVTCETDRMRIKAMLSTQLGILLRQLNQTNRHLHPCSIVLQDFVDGPVVALSMFVTKTGQPIFIACCEQLFDNNSHWIGGTISYPQQAQFRKTFSTLMDKVAAFLHRKGYHGPAGIDIVTDQHSGEQFVIDLNVRVTGTFHLGPLKGHFTRRGLSEAAMTSGDFLCTRDMFEEAFSEEIRQGSLVVSGWVHHESLSKSHAAITVGSKDRDTLQEYLRRIRTVGQQD